MTILDGLDGCGPPSVVTLHALGNASECFGRTEHRVIVDAMTKAVAFNGSLLPDKFKSGGAQARNSVMI